MFTEIGNWDVWNSNMSAEALFSGLAGATVATFVLIMLALALALYVYHSLAWMKIAKKMKFKYAWLAWIPIASEAMKLKLGKFHWAWIFLILIPILGWIALIVLLTISTWRIFEVQKYPGWLALSFPAMFLPFISRIGFVAYFVMIGLVAWRKK